jgi:hypothetical protein
MSTFLASRRLPFIGIYGFLFFFLCSARGVGMTLRAQLSRAAGFVDRWARARVGVWNKRVVRLRFGMPSVHFCQGIGINFDLFAPHKTRG